MEKYKRFKIGDRVIAATNNVLYANIGDLKDNAPVGTEFEIKAFPAQITQDPNYTNYVRGVTDKGEIVTCYPKDIIKVSNRTIDKILHPVNCKFGAPMGRSNVGTHPHLGNVTKKQLKIKVFNCSVPLYSGGYDKGSAYWGIGKELRCEYTKDLSYIRFYRIGDTMSWK